MLSWRHARAALVMGAMAWLCLSGAASAQQQSVLVAEVDGAITPVTAAYLADAVTEAEAGGHEALLVELDTPGGLDTSMRDIVQNFLASPVPVIVYVTPSGARAASAGAIITFAANIAAMSPGTTIGAATPVSAESGETASDKIINDAAAFAESVAAQRDRNTEFAVDTVREGKAVTADTAVEIDAVDLAAADRSELFAALDGQRVSTTEGERELDTADATVTEYEFGVLREILQLIADPNLAFLFLSIGTLAVIYELATPGMGLGGVTGAILLILGFFALSVLPVNIAGILLLILAAGLFLAEALTAEMGILATGGAVSLVFAGLFLFEGPMSVSLGVLLPTAVIVAVGSLLAGRLAWRARNRVPVSGRESVIGSSATVGGVEAGGARVFLEGSWWTARSHADLHPGQRIRIRDIDGLTLIVEPDEIEEEPDA